MDDNTKSRWGRDLPGKLQDKWPKTENGEFEEPAFLKRCGAADLEDELLVNMLDAYGIPCIRQYPNDGSLGKVLLGMSGTGVELYVPKSRLEEAADLCKGEPDDENV